jgi:hypothetical protein
MLGFRKGTAKKYKVSFISGASMLAQSSVTSDRPVGYGSDVTGVDARACGPEATGLVGSMRPLSPWSFQSPSTHRFIRLVPE